MIIATPFRCRRFGRLKNTGADCFCFVSHLTIVMPRSLHLSEFERDFAALGAKPTHIRRLWRAWLGLASWQSQGHASYPKSLQEKLPEIQSELESLARFNVRESQQAESSKLLVMLPDGACVEAVLLPRQALCISTQVGCAVGCAFCKIGRAHV